METPTLLAHQENSTVSSPVLISHRGLWFPDHSAENTEAAFAAACAGGFGVELDVRQDSLWCGRLVVSHDSPRTDCDSHLHLADALAFLAKSNCSVVAVNVKEEGYEAELIAAVDEAGLLHRAFFFDQSSESSQRLITSSRQPVRVLARASDRDEPLDRALASPAWGVWMDQFDTDWFAEDVIAQVHAAGKTAWIVSPELHGRTLDLGAAERWLTADGICTDVPHLLVKLLKEWTCPTWKK